MKAMESFNPYFTGSNSGRYTIGLSIYSFMKVSILILLEVILEGNIRLSSAV